MSQILRALRSLALWWAVCVTQALAQNYPERAVRLVVTHAAGGSVDTVARIVQPYLREQLGVPVIIENMPGVGGDIARSYVYKQPPNGYVLLMSTQPSMSVAHVLNKPPYEPLRFTHVFNITGGSFDALAVQSTSPWTSIDDLRKAAQSKPLTLAGSGVGTTNYVLAMLLKAKAGIALTYIPFDSGSQTALALAGKHVQVGITQISTLWPLHEARQLRVLAVFSSKSDPAHPEIPTTAALGYPSLQIDSMVGVFAPPGLPEDRTEILARAFRKVAVDKKFLKAAETAGLFIRPLEPAAFLTETERFTREIESIRPILQSGTNR